MEYILNDKYYVLALQHEEQTKPMDKPIIDTNQISDQSNSPKQVKIESNSSRIIHNNCGSCVSPCISTAKPKIQSRTKYIVLSNNTVAINAAGTAMDTLTSTNSTATISTSHVSINPSDSYLYCHTDSAVLTDLASNKLVANLAYISTSEFVKYTNQTETVIDTKIASQCNICMEDFHKPVYLKCCKNFICIKCILTIINHVGNTRIEFKCPLCRRKIESLEYAITDIVNIIKFDQECINSKPYWMTQIANALFSDDNKPIVTVIVNDTILANDDIYSTLIKLQSLYPIHIFNIGHDTNANVSDYLFYIIHVDDVVDDLLMYQFNCKYKLMFKSDYGSSVKSCSIKNMHEFMTLVQTHTKPNSVNTVLCSSSDDSSNDSSYEMQEMD